MATNLEDLGAAVETLQLTYDKARHRLDEQGFPDPLSVVDYHGRYVLLEALTALVNARTALANAGGNREVEDLEAAGDTEGAGFVAESAAILRKRAAELRGEEK